MADCGASGSVLDRSASALVNTVLNNANNSQASQATIQAGKNIGSFLSNVAVTHRTTTGTGSTTSDGIHGQMNVGNVSSVMSVALPEHMSHVQDVNNDAILSIYSGPSPSSQLVAQVPNNQHFSGGVGVEMTQQQQQQELNLMNNIYHKASPVQPTISTEMVPRHLIQQQQQQAQMNQQMNMNMQMQMMNQQMAMMHQHQLQQQQQLQHHQQQQQSKPQSQDINDQDTSKIDNTTTSTTNNDELNIDNWHQDLQEEIQSYINNDEQLGHEGMTDGASIEQLAAAWEQAEREYGQSLERNEFTQLEGGSFTTTTDDTTTNIPSSAWENLTQINTHYQFQQESKMYGMTMTNNTIQDPQEQPSIDLMEEGIQHFENGNTSKAILCLESHLQNVDSDSSDAWYLLGKCHAENDEDMKAITCLEKAVERDPYSTDALLALGVSYVNELNQERALQHLKDWVTHNPSYAGLDLQSSPDLLGTTQAQQPWEELKSLLLSALAYTQSHNDNENSAHVLEVLGVLCNVSQELDQAISYLRSATELQPNNYALYNKLGATLANNNQSEDALTMYHEALKLKPKYARAWLNLAISHANLQNFDDCIRCYLQTLSLNPRAVHVWSYLRIALTASEQWDLIPLVAEQNLEAFKSKYDFVSE